MALKLSTTSALFTLIFAAAAQAAPTQNEIQNIAAAKGISADSACIYHAATVGGWVRDTSRFVGIDYNPLDHYRYNFIQIHNAFVAIHDFAKYKTNDPNDAAQINVWITYLHNAMNDQHLANFCLASLEDKLAVVKNATANLNKPGSREIIRKAANDSLQEANQFINLNNI